VLEKSVEDGGCRGDIPGQFFPILQGDERGPFKNYGFSTGRLQSSAGDRPNDTGGNAADGHIDIGYVAADFADVLASDADEIDDLGFGEFFG